MSTSELSADESQSSGSSEITLSDFEQEIEEFEMLSDGSVSCGQSSLDESEKASCLCAPVPYDDEPLSHAEWVEKYKEKKEKSKVIESQALQGRLEGRGPISDW